MRVSRLVGLFLALVLCLSLPKFVSAAASGAVDLLGASNDLGTAVFGEINQTTGVFTFRGNTPTGFQMPALSCNAQQSLFGSENRTPTEPMTPVGGGGRCGFLVGLNPANGAVTQSFGFITLAGSPNSCLRISDFDFNPANGVLYGVGRANSTRDGLFTISLTTPPVATLVGLLDPTCTTGCLERGGMAFRKDGALFVASVERQFARINPADASVIGSILPMTDCVEGMSFRNSDDVLFATECDSDDLFTINVTTGVQTPLNASPGASVGSLAFCGDRGGIVGGATPTPTVAGPTATPTGVPTAAPTSTPPVIGPVAVPTMSGLTMALFGLILAAVAILVLRVRG